MSELFAGTTSVVVGSGDLAASGGAGSFRIPLSSALMLGGEWCCRLHSIQPPQAPDKNSVFVSCDFVESSVAGSGSLNVLHKTRAMTAAAPGPVHVLDQSPNPICRKVSKNVINAMTLTLASSGGAQLPATPGQFTTAEIVFVRRKQPPGPRASMRKTPPSEHKDPHTMPPKAKKQAPAPVARPRRTKSFRKLALAAATLAALGALLQKSRGADKLRPLGANRCRQRLAGTNAASLSQSETGWKRGHDLGLTGKKAGTSRQHALFGDVVLSSAFQEAAEGLAKGIGASRALKPPEKLGAAAAGEGFLRHVNPRRIRFTRPMKMLGAAAALLLALGAHADELCQPV